MAAAFPEMALSALEDVLKFDGAVALKEIDLPIRSLNSDLPVVPFKVIRGNTEDFKLRFIPNTGHFLMIEDPQLFNRYFAEFLKEIILASY
jgi:pimeloyl-ACP methyl ester carboxylesterase